MLGLAIIILFSIAIGISIIDGLCVNIKHKNADTLLWESIPWFENHSISGTTQADSSSSWRAEDYGSHVAISVKEYEPYPLQKLSNLQQISIVIGLLALVLLLVIGIPYTLFVLFA